MEIRRAPRNGHEDSLDPASGSAPEATPTGTMTIVRTRSGDAVPGSTETAPDKKGNFFSRVKNKLTGVAGGVGHAVGGAGHLGVEGAKAVGSAAGKPVELSRHGAEALITNMDHVLEHTKVFGRSVAHFATRMGSSMVISSGLKEVSKDLLIASGAVGVVGGGVVGTVVIGGFVGAMSGALFEYGRQINKNLDREAAADPSVAGRRAAFLLKFKEFRHARVLKPTDLRRIRNAALIGAVAGAGAGALAEHTQILDFIKPYTSAFGEKIGGVFGAAGITLGEAGGAVGGFVSGAGDLAGAIGHTAGDLAGGAGNLAGEAGRVGGDIAGGIGHTAGDLAGGAGNLAGGAGEAAGNLAHGAGDVAGKVSETIGGVAGGTGEAVGGMAGKVGEIGGGIAGGTGNLAGEAGRVGGDIAGGIGGAVGEVAGGIGHTAGDLAGNAKDMAGNIPGVHGVGDIAGDAKDMVGNLPGVHEVGDAVGGAWNGAGEMAGNARDWAGTAPGVEGVQGIAGGAWQGAGEMVDNAKSAVGLGGVHEAGQQVAAEAGHQAAGETVQAVAPEGFVPQADLDQANQTIADLQRQLAEAKALAGAGAATGAAAVTAAVVDQAHTALNQFGDSILLPAGSNPWEMSTTILKQMGVNPTPEQIMQLDKVLSQENSIGVPAWGIKGTIDANNLPVGFKLNLTDIVKKTALAIASKK